MFSLIITIISIALVAALALATIYYGGSAFSQGGDAAKASQLINEGQQLQGARTLRAVQEPSAANIAAVGDLAPKYLAQVPAGWGLDTTAGTFTNVVATDAVCRVVNEKAGLPNGATDVVSATTAASKVYFCDTATKTVTYKF